MNVVDLFAGCGGMTLGLWEAARRAYRALDIRLALDNDASAMSVYLSNFPNAKVNAVQIESVFDGALGATPSNKEARASEQVGGVDVLVGGPPCQGHSDLNNHTRRQDPRNALYLRMARAAEVLRPSVMVIENVVAVQNDKSAVVAQTNQHLEQLGYRVAGRVLDLNRVGVPQRRRRFVVLASTLPGFNPNGVLGTLSEGLGNHRDRTVRWAISDLLDLKADSAFDTPSRANEENAKRIRLLFEKGKFELPNKHRPECHRDGEHSYNSVYGRLRWDKPAQTITTGFGCMGQGRYVHPQRRRTITPHEAARLQTFPDWFDFGRNSRRGLLAKFIGNAVPPLLMVRLGELLMPSIEHRER